MIRAAALAVLIGGNPALAQVAPAQPSRPAVTRPAAPKGPVAPQVKPAASPKLPALQSELKSVEGRIAALKAKQSAKDGASELGEQDMLLLQQLMDQKSQLESMISNIMKGGHEGGESAVSALKAS
jgi:hypothetical protein